MLAGTNASIFPQGHAAVAHSKETPCCEYHCNMLALDCLMKTPCVAL